MESTISIRAWRNEIRVPREHPAPERIRADIDAMTAQICDALAEGIGAYVERKAGAVILIRELAFDCDLDTRCDRHEAARALAVRCADALVRTVESSSANVVRFDSRAAFVAHFIGDLAAGSAWGQWYYAGFDGIRVLETSAAIRTVLLDDPEVGRDALAAVALGAWPALARALSNVEAARILDGLVEDCDASSVDIDPARWLAALRAPAVAVMAAPAQVTALMLYAGALRSGEAASGFGVRVARTLGAVAMLASIGAHAAIEALAQGDVRGLANFERGLAGDLATHLAGADGPTLCALAQQAQRTLCQRAAEPSSDTTRTPFAAPFAGLGLLLEEIDRLLDADFTAALPTIGDVPTREAAALTVIAIAAGTGRARLAWHDAAWRDFFEIGPAFTWDAYATALSHAGIEAAERARKALAGMASGHLRGEPIETALRVRGVRLRCDADASNGLWLALRKDDGEQRQNQSQSRGHDHGPESGSGFDSDPRRPVAPAAPLNARLAAARRARADWRELAGGDHNDDALGASLPLEWRIVFVACAQIAWRRLAQRVPGMSGASIGYLRDNLLGVGEAATRLAPDRWCWSVRRPPLHVLLNLTGIARSAQTWRGPPQRRIEWDFR